MKPRTLLVTMLVGWLLVCTASTQQTFDKAPTAKEKAIKPLSLEEKFTIRTDQRDLDNANSQLMRFLESTPQYKQVQALQERMNKDVEAIYASRSVKPIDHTLCDGPADGRAACKGVAQGDLALVENPKEEVKK